MTADDGSPGGRRRAARRLAVALLAGALAWQPGLADPAARPRVALVLSGGGARGAAHVGVLKVLEEMHVRPDLVVGTSIGAILGGLYAAGYSADEIEKILANLDWDTVFSDRVDRADKTFRRRQDDATFLVPTRLRFKGWRPYLPPALLGGQRLDLLLRGLQIEATGATRFDDFPIPFRAVAADLTTGEAVVLDHGDLATAMRASMAIPGIFPPVVIDGRPLVDGGSAANLPIGIAQDLGADVVIAVDITSPLSTRAELRSVFSILSQEAGFITLANRAADLARLRPGDVLIRPDLGTLSFTDFDRALEAIAPGEAAARAAAPRLARLAVTDEAWRAFRARHRTRPASDLVVDRIAIRNTSPVDDRVVADRLRLQTGKPFDRRTVDHQLMRLSALDYFGPIRERFETEDGAGTLTVETPGKAYGRGSLQFGVSFADDFQGETGYTLAVRHLLLAANRRGGEWENVGQIGDTGLLRTEFYQPLDFRLRWFVAPGGESRRDRLVIWQDRRAVSEYTVRTNEGHVDLGRVLGDWGEIRLGPFYAYDRGAPRIGEPVFSEYAEHTGGLRAQFRADTRDATVFPRHGLLAQARWLRAYASWGSDAGRTQAAASVGQAFTAGRVTFLPSVEAEAKIDGPSTVGSSCALGGLLRLSGLGTQELRDDRCGLARVMAYVELSHIDLGVLSSRLYAGLSLEAGNVYAETDPITRNSLRHGGSLFVGAQTLLGPVYLGWGVADGGDGRFYLVLGQRF